MTESRSAQSSDALPEMIGLCPWPVHTVEFYVPLRPGESTICPEPGCGREMFVYSPAHLQREIDRIERDSESTPRSPFGA